MNKVARKYDLINSKSATTYIALSIGMRKLLTDRKNIKSIESINVLDTSEPLTNSIGSLKINNETVPVYNINDKLEIDGLSAGENTVCAVLSVDGEYISIACKEVSAFTDTIIRIDSLPECMQTVVCPVDTLCLVAASNAKNVEFITSPETLRNYFHNYDKR